MHRPPLDELLLAVRAICRRTDAERDDVLQEICDLLQGKVPHYDWVGFYYAESVPRVLLLGPYAGAPTDHKQIPYGKGVCGQAAETEETIVVDDVTEEGNYLACSLDTQSEIVVPVMKDGAFVAELDLDSHTIGAFTAADRAFLEEVARLAAEWF
ncbi:MAG: GAF domain-containing protein [Phycisphaerae bacterium]